MKYVLYVVAIICATIISIALLKNPLEERGIEGIGSIAIRIVLGIALGFLFGFLMQL